MLITAIYKARFPLLRKGSKTLGRSRSLRFIFGQKPLLNALRGGFSCFWLKKNATKMHRWGC